MKNRYIDLVEQTFDFPQAEFDRDKNGDLRFHDIPLMDVIERFGTPLKFFYLPVIGEQIGEARGWFREAMKKHDYEGDYHYCYVTKSNHFAHVIKETIEQGTHLETSSAYDVMIMTKLFEEGTLPADRYIVCNGFKTDEYLDSIVALRNKGYENIVPVIDNLSEYDRLDQKLQEPMNIGLRIASEEEPKFEFYTSRLGIGYKNIVPFYLEQVQDNEKFNLKMLHFFVNTGIRDNAYYWGELTKCLRVYCELKKVAQGLDSLNIGGGFPIKNSLSFEFEYDYIVDEIISQVKMVCGEFGVPVPHIFTEFGSFTVGEAGGALYSVLLQKRQNDRECWNMIDSSFMTTLPDTWAINRRFIMLPKNHWEKEYERVFLGGLTCDSDDYYNSEQHINAIYLPKFDKNNTLYPGFFNTGAYQESIGGYGGIQHCLTPSPKYVIIDKDENGNFKYKLFRDTESAATMLNILGY
ncbi:MAG: arginine decarboxylase [Flavobacteriales bacterium]|nr:arginine decarboxylase [Flavobacteriales bacterium]